MIGRLIRGNLDWMSSLLLLDLSEVELLIKRKGEGVFFVAAGPW